MSVSTPASTAENISSYKTALVLLPPAEIAARLNPFREVHDKAGSRWTSHITLHFSFEETPNFPEVIASIRNGLSQLTPFTFKLGSVGSFSLSGYDTFHLKPSQSSEAQLQGIWSVVANALKYTGRPFIPHLTVGQAPHGYPDVSTSLQRKAGLLLESVRDVPWSVRSVVLLRKDDTDGGKMKLYHEMFLAGESESSYQLPRPNPTFQFMGGSWNDILIPPTPILPTAVSIMTYNILYDDAFPVSERIASIERRIGTSKSDILALQEVSDLALRHLLSSPEISKAFPFSNRHPDIVLENERNILILSKHPFTWNKLIVGGKHKPAILASFRNPSGTPLVFAAIHLTAGRAASPLEQKTQEIESLISHLCDVHATSDWIIAGDTNWPENIFMPAEDLFTDAGTICPHPPTYDPQKNVLASLTAREGTDAHRYDRVYAKTNGEWCIHSSTVLGMNDAPESDHWPLEVSLRQRDAQASSSSTEVQSDVIYALPETTLTTEELLELGSQEMPTESQEVLMQQAVDLLRQVICQRKHPTVNIHLEPVGSFGLGTHTLSSDVDCLAVANVSAATFWSIARSNIRESSTSGSGLNLRRFVKDAIVQKMELDVGGIKIDMQYCPAPNLCGERWSTVGSLPPNSPLFLLPASSLITLNAYRDLLTLKKIIPSLPNFRVALRALKLFHSTNGIYGARFGFLGGFHLTLLLTRVALTIPPNAEPHHLVRQFFRTYANWNWQRDMVWPIPSRQTNDAASGYRRNSNREPMVVLSIERPLANLTFHASLNSVEVISKQYLAADQALAAGESWKTVCGFANESATPEQRFLNAYKLFIKLDVHFWGGSCMKGRALVGWLESRLVALLVELQSVVPEVNVRFWPNRLVDAISFDHSSRDPNGFYLFGLSPSGSSQSPTVDIQQRNQVVEGALLRCLRAFETKLLSNERFYDPSQSFIALSCCKRSQLPKAIVIDPFTWPDKGFDIEIDSDDDEADSSSSPQRHADEMQDSAPSSSSSSQRKKALAAKAKATSRIVAPKKLRTSSDVLNRLLWDPNVPKDDFIIGYEDRFVGIKEVALGAWSREVESESFIPLHRIVYFKRTSDDLVVWDKRSKTDLIFGTGVSGQEPVNPLFSHPG